MKRNLKVCRLCDCFEDYKNTIPLICKMHRPSEGDPEDFRKDFEEREVPKKCEYKLELLVMNEIM